MTVSLRLVAGTACLFNASDCTVQCVIQRRLKIAKSADLFGVGERYHDQLLAQLVLDVVGFLG